MQSAQDFQEPIYTSTKCQILLLVRYDPAERQEVTVVHKLFLTNEPAAYREMLLHRAAYESIPNGIVRFITEYVVQGRLGFLMEPCKQETLLRMAELCEANENLWTEHEILVLTLNMLTIVYRLHHIHIAHKAINAENWLLTSDGVLKLTDFGSAELISEVSENQEEQETLPSLPANQFQLDLQGIGNTLCQITMLGVEGKSAVMTDWSKKPAFERNTNIKQRFKKKRYSQQFADWVIELLEAKRSLEDLIRAVQVEVERGPQ